MKFITISVLTAAMSFANAVAARTEVERHEAVVLPNTQIRKIHSSSTNQDYRIYVSVPASYFETPNKTYPSLFMLDADYSFALAKQITEHLSDRNDIPECFVFGIGYDGPLSYRLHRSRDYTPTFVAEGGYGPEFQRHSGGGNAFANFLEKELIPYLSKSFRLSKQKVLSGHSYGGLFASWMLTTRPNVFEGYIIVSPSLWYGNKALFEMQRQATTIPMQTRAFFAVGSLESPRFGGGYDMVNDMKEFVSNLESTDHVNLALSSQVFDDENHDTVFPAAFSKGIRFVLKKPS